MKSVNNQIHVHIDADAFFASVEQVLHRELKGKALVVGQNGGIVSALSYPAKAMGIPRVMPIISVRKHYPQVSVVSSDFYAYGIFSDRMDRIIRDHLPNLVKNSIDECSANMDAWVKNFDAAKIFVEIIKKELELKLGCTFSFGIARTPLLAKLASGLNKPNGITVLTDENIQDLIYHFPVNYISGIGAQTYKSLKKYRIHSIGDFAKADHEWLQSAFSITLPALHKQILGSATRIPKQKETIKDMSRAQTFPPTNNYDYLYSQASMNIEHLTKRMRRMNVFSKRICIQLRDQELAYTQSCISLTSPTRNPEYLLHELDILLKNIYQENTLYRQVSIRCTGLEEQIVQDDLFGNSKISQSKDSTLSIIDSLEIRFGKSCIGLATSLPAKDKLGKLYTQHTQGDTYPHPLLPGEEIQKRLIYPFLGIIN
jgi:nucleotidyltransferase/DNA polymerase involved in DNA repair